MEVQVLDRMSIYLLMYTYVQMHKHSAIQHIRT